MTKNNEVKKDETVCVGRTLKDRIELPKEDANTFIRIPTRSVSDSRLTHAELRVLSAICRYTDNTTGKAFPSIDTLREAACVSLNTLRTSIRKLESLKYVTVSTRKAENGGQLSNVYCVKF